MYRPEKYQKDDKDFIFSFIQENPFATFVVNGKRLLATHIPVLLEGDKNNYRLYSHIANHNEQLQYLQDDAEALIIFHGANSYVSSSWYTEKDISTWDYSAVHINATITLQTREELESSLYKLVRHFEQDQEKPLYYHELPHKMLYEHLPLITGFWLEPFKVEGIAKLHQSYPRQEIDKVVSKLEKKGDSKAKKVSEAIKKENGID